MKINLIFIIGVVFLLFAALGYFGNFVKWSDVEQTNAKILNAEKQWLRKGAGNINLDIQYSVDGSDHKATASVSASTLQTAAVNGEIEVYYKKKNPERVIPVAVLKGKQKTVIIALSVGIILTIVGIILGIRNKSKLPLPDNEPKG